MILSGTKVNLRHSESADAESIARYAHNKKISEFTFIPYPYTEKDAQVFINSIKKDREDMTGLHLGIENKPDGKIIGMVGLNVINHVHYSSKGGCIWGSNCRCFRN